MNRRFFLTFERVIAFAAIRSNIRSIIADSSLFMVELLVFGKALAAV